MLINGLLILPIAAPILNRKANQPYTDVKSEKKMCYLMCRKCSAKSIFHFMSTSEAKNIVL